MSDLNKITIIGATGAGKTTYLAGMYNQMRRGVKGFNLVANADTDFELRQYWKSVINDSTLPTSATSSFEFSLARNYKRIQTGDFEWIDYAGGILTGPDSKELNDLKRNIKESACVLLLLDGNNFRVEANSFDEYLEKVDDNFCDGTDKDAVDLDAIQKLGEIIAENEDEGRYIPVVVVVTKVDLIPPKWTEEGRNFADVKRVVMECNSLTSLRGDKSTPNRVMMVSAVTLGMDYVKTKKVEPQKFGEPLAFAVLCTLHDQYLSIMEERGKMQHYYNKEKGKNWFDKLWKGDKSLKYQELLRKVDDNTKESIVDAGKLYSLLDNGNKKVLHGGYEITVKDFFGM